MSQAPITSTEDALLRAINAAQTAQRALRELIADTGCEPEEETMEAASRAKADEEACMAYLQANAPKCPGCKQAFAFQRQEKRPNRCSWCGYDHDSGSMPSLIPA